MSEELNVEVPDVDLPARAKTNLNIQQRIAAVMAQIAYVQKTKQVGSEKWGYMAVTHDQVTALTRPLFLKHGVDIETQQQSGVSVVTGTCTGKGTPIIRYEAMYAVAFVNVDEPTDRIVMVVGAHANDEGDKAPGKAVSYAVKTAILKKLQLETGEDEESRYNAEPSPPEGAEPAPRTSGKIEPPKATREKAAPAPAKVEPASKGLISMIRTFAGKRGLKEDELIEHAVEDGHAVVEKLESLEKSAAAALLTWVKAQPETASA